MARLLNLIGFLLLCFVSGLVMWKALSPPDERTPLNPQSPLFVRLRQSTGLELTSSGSIPAQAACDAVIAWVSTRPMATVISGNDAIVDLEVLREFHLAPLLDSKRGSLTQSSVATADTLRALFDLAVLSEALYLASLRSGNLDMAIEADLIVPDGVSTPRVSSLIRVMVAETMLDRAETQAGPPVSTDSFQKIREILSIAVRQQPDYFYAHTAYSKLLAGRYKATFSRRPTFADTNDFAGRVLDIRNASDSLAQAFLSYLHLSGVDTTVANRGRAGQPALRFVTPQISFREPPPPASKDRAFWLHYAVFLNNQLDYFNWKLLPTIFRGNPEVAMAHRLGHVSPAFSFTDVDQRVIPDLEYAMRQSEADAMTRFRIRATELEFRALLRHWTDIHPPVKGQPTTADAQLALSQGVGDLTRTIHDGTLAPSVRRLYANYLRHSPFLTRAELAPVLEALDE